MIWAAALVSHSRRCIGYIDPNGGHPAAGGESIVAFLIIGVLLLAGKLADIGPMGGWSWWIVLTPFGLTTVWWAISDKFGLTQRKAMKRMDDRKEKRRAEAMEALGLNKRRVKQVTRAEEDVRRGDGASADPTHRN